MCSIQKMQFEHESKKISYVFDELEQKVIMCVQKMCSLIKLWKMSDGFDGKNVIWK